jgi:hypothetical protein
MPLYICSFCNYNTIDKYYYYSHLYKHISEDTIKSFTDEDIQLCNFYYNKRNQKQAKYRNNNKEKIAEKSKNNYNKETYRNYYYKNREKKLAYNKEYRQNNKEQISKYDKTYSQNNKDKILQRMKEYRLKKKLEKEDANILDIYDSD